jgi:hypothetical protein
MTSPAEIENRARLSRTTCGWRKSGLAVEDVRRYWRDVHSPAISRRAGVYLYRHSPFDAVREDLFSPLDDIEFSCRDDRQLQWQSDIIYHEENALDVFFRSPESAEVTAQLLADIELIVDKSTTYRTVGDNLHTYIDRTGDPAPQGPVPRPRFGIFFRQRAGEDEFRALLRDLAQRWSADTGVLRLRLNLFDRPDMEAERAAGYPVKTHPVDQQYQAWMDLVLQDDGVARSLIRSGDGIDYAASMAAIHAYPVPAIYTFVYAGVPTLTGLRGYPAHQAVQALGAENAKDIRLLEWMYGPIVHGWSPAT